MLTDSKSWLLIIASVAGIGYGAYDYISSENAAQSALRENTAILAGLDGLLSQKRKTLNDLEIVGVALRDAAVKNQQLLKAREDLIEKQTQIRTEIEKTSDLMKVAVEKVRSNAAGVEIDEFAVGNGKTLRAVKVTKVTEAGISLMHADGVGAVEVDSLPENFKERFDLGPNAVLQRLSTAKQTLLAKLDEVENVKPRLPETSVGAGGLSGATPTAAISPGNAAAASAPSPESFDPNCLVFIKTDSGAGSGFIARVGDKTYVYTNAHVLCGSPGGFTKKFVSIKTATGRTIPTPYQLELSDMYDPSSSNGLEDMARFPITLKEGEVSYELGGLDVNTSMSQNVVAYGNSLGGDVITSLPGNILGLGTDRIEISCGIVAGNSGGPVVLADSNKVIGVSTYLSSGGNRDIWTSGTTFSQVRRFALRPDKITKWRRMLYTSLMSSLAELAAFDRDTLSLAAACFLNPKPNRGGFDVPSQRNGDYVIREVLVDGGRYPLGGTINAGIAKVNQRLGATKSTMSVVSVVPVFAEFFNTVAGTSASQMSSLQSADRAPYLKQFIPELIAIRKRIHERFVQEGVTRYR